MSIFGKRNNVITYTVNKATNRDMYITIQNGEVIVNAPWYFTQNKIQAVVEEKKNWILSKINEYQQQSSNMQSVKIFGKNYDLKVVYSNIDTPELNIEENNDIINNDKVGEFVVDNSLYTESQNITSGNQINNTIPNNYMVNNMNTNNVVNSPNNIPNIYTNAVEVTPSVPNNINVTSINNNQNIS